MRTEFFVEIRHGPTIGRASVVVSKISNSVLYLSNYLHLTKNVGKQKSVEKSPIRLR